jgi:hypothetical protein
MYFSTKVKNADKVFGKDENVIPQLPAIAKKRLAYKCQNLIS